MKFEGARCRRERTLGTRRESARSAATEDRGWSLGGEPLSLLPSLALQSGHSLPNHLTAHFSSATMTVSIGAACLKSAVPVVFCAIAMARSSLNLDTQNQIALLKNRTSWFPHSRILLFSGRCERGLEVRNGLLDWVARGRSICTARL